MIRQTMYRLATGEIIGWVEAETSIGVLAPPGCALTPGLFLPPDAYRVEAGQVVRRAVMAPSLSAAAIAADGVAACVIAGLPDPCLVTITGAVQAGPVQVDGGTLTLTSTQPGAITVVVRADPTFAPWQATIHAH